MKKNPTLVTSSAETEPVRSTAPESAPTEQSTPAPKRGFKPRWLRLQRRERKLREARALALRASVG
jgi:hypothetical protein